MAAGCGLDGKSRWIWRGYDPGAPGTAGRNQHHSGKGTAAAAGPVREHGCAFGGGEKGGGCVPLCPAGRGAGAFAAAGAAPPGDRTGADGRGIPPAMGNFLRRAGPVCGDPGRYASERGGILPDAAAGADPVQRGHHSGHPGPGEGQRDDPGRPQKGAGTFPAGVQRPCAAPGEPERRHIGPQGQKLFAGA